jgi:CheY-like chemotaxis protein
MDGRSVCVLLVDDEETVLEVGVMMLERLGYQVFGARSSAEAVESLSSKQRRDRSGSAGS